MRRDAGGAISINGARPTSNNYLLDGTSNTDTALGTPAAILSIDAIQEFKEQTATYSAEYGFSANQINIVSKTGTNELHGSLFHFLRNDALDASTFFNNLSDTPKNPAPPEPVRIRGWRSCYQEQDLLAGQLRRDGAPGGLRSRS